MTCERAKMFAPFDALKGFREELAKKEDEPKQGDEEK